MPHIIIECSENVLKTSNPEEIVQKVYDTTVSTESFEKNVMVRIVPFKHYTVMGNKDAFIYVFTSVLEGRTTEQRRALSINIVTLLKGMFPEVTKVSMNIREFERATFINNSML
jgi:5-carboxymethyl-2-hydroxymuconate isomerase